MLSIQQTPISREQFGLLMQAKHKIRQEFKANISLKSASVLDDILEFSVKSSNDELFNLFDDLCKASLRA